MAPKQQKVRTPPRAAGGTASAAAAAAQPPTAEDEAIARVLVDVESNLAVIKAHKVFKDIMTADPLKIGAGGIQMPFSQESFAVVVAGGGAYTAGINFMWIGHKMRAMTGVPIAQRAINEFLVPDRFADYTFPTMLEIAVDNHGYKPLEHKGALLRLTPPEESFALLLRIRQDIEAGVGEDVLKKWRSCLLSVTAKFVLVDSAQDRWWYEYNRQEDVGATFTALYQTAYQRICGIIRLVDEAIAAHGRDAGSIAKIAGLFKDKARDGSGPGGEKVTETYIKEVLVVREHVLSNPKVRQIVQALDEKDGHNNAMNSVYKLGAIRRFAKTAANIEWVCAAIQDPAPPGHVSSWS